MRARPVLLFAYGNPSRGDDALAPRLLDQIREQDFPSACGHPLHFLNDFQIQIEHVMDLQGAERVLLMDASCILDKAFRLSGVSARLETHYTTHGMSPATLLHTYQQVFHEEPPPTSMLLIKGHHYELGKDLSAPAKDNLLLAYQFLTGLLTDNDFSRWDASLEGDEAG